MNLPRLLCLTLLLLTIASSSFAGIVDRTPLAEPRSELVDIGRGAVVASESSGMFLLHGQRITTEGVNLDGERIPGTEGMAVGWTDGWLIIAGTLNYHEIRHLGSDGTLTPFHKLPRRGPLLSAAANDGRLAILERESGNPTRVWITVLDDTGVVRHAPLAQLHTGAITAFGSGFMAVTSVSTRSTTILHAWLIDRQGIPREFETIGEVSLYSVPSDPEVSPLLTVSKSGDRALFRTRRELYLIDADLSISGPITFPGFGDVTPLAIDEGFLVTYGYWTSAFGTIWRARTITSDGTVSEPQEIDPIVAGDRIGDTYLVLRPWGHAGLAKGDPRNIVEALRMKVRLHQPPSSVETTVSDEVTLTSITYNRLRQDQQPGGRFFVRFDAEGNVLDDEPVPFPFPGNIVIAIPDGFAFFALQQSGITMRRLDARGGWIDEEPVVIQTVDPDTRTFAADAGEDTLLVAWVTDDEILWSVFTFDGTPLREEPHRLSRESDLPSSNLVINGRGNGDRLLMLEDTDFPCAVLCPFRSLLWSVGIDANGDAIGLLNELPPSVGLRAVGLPDGTWASPSREVVHQLSRSGMLLQEVPSPFPDREPLDLRETPLGWEAIVPNPLRLVELAGLADPVRVTGLEGLSTPRFGFGDRLAFIAEVPGPEEGSVPWNGRLETVPGDLAVSIIRTGSDERGHHFGIYVRNDGSTTATSVHLYAPIMYIDGEIFRVVAPLPPLAPGQTIHVPATMESRGFIEEARVHVYSNDITDVAPDDNTAHLFTSPTAPTRHRPAPRR